MDERVLRLNQVLCDSLWWIEECQAQQTFFEWISQEIASPMSPRRGMFPASLLVGHLVDGLSHCLLRKRVFFRHNIVAFLGGSTPKQSRNFTFTVSMVSPE
jgi:hypothetical protein